MKLAGFVVALFLLTSVHSGAQSDASWFPLSKWSISSVQCLSEQDKAILARRVDTGDAEAQDALGTQLLSGCQSTKDPAKGIELLSRAAAQGNAHAQLRLGEAYQSGTLVKKSIPVAITWFEKSAAQGNARAQNDLGIFYLYGDNVVKDEPRAAELFKAAAEQDLAEAAYNLATLYDQGHGVAQDYRLARKWYQQAAERKDADAEYRLAVLLEQSLGGDADPVAAMRWLRRAAEDGSQDAQLKLGLKLPSQAQTLSSGYFQYQIARAFFEGKAVTKDPANALKFLEKSADAGYPAAFLALGRMYARGDGVAKNEAKALGYFEQAIAHDTKNDMAYNTLAWTLITADDVKLRDPKRALELANKAVELSGGKEAYQLDTLAHAHFALGDIAEARKIESRALALQPDSDFYQKALAEFENAKEPPASK
jgi:TPR repeat protein